MTSQASMRGLSWRQLAIAGGVYGAVLCGVAVRRADGVLDFRRFWLTALTFRQTGRVVTDFGIDNHLPAFAILMTPWTLLPLRAAIVVFEGVSILAFAATIVIAERMLTGQVPERPRPATVAAIVLTLPYAHASLVLGQVGFVLLFLCVAGTYAVWRGRPIVGGALIGLAAVLKILPAVLFAYLLFRRHMRALASAMATAALLGIGLPVVLLGWRQTVALHRDHYERAVKAGGAWAAITTESPIKARYNNNAVPIVLRRLLSHLSGAGIEHPSALYVNLVDVPRGAIAGLYGVICAAVLAVSVWCTLRAPPGADGWPFAIWCAALLLLSPLVWTHYLVLMYWPIAYLTSERRSGLLKTGLVNATLAIWTLAVFALMWPAARAAGAQIIAVAAVWLALTWAKRGD